MTDIVERLRAIKVVDGMTGRRLTPVFGGMTVRIVDAQKQQRTPRDVCGPWVRPKVPNKRIGRKGTRRQWKRRNPPRHIMLYREPNDVLVLLNRIIIATPIQADAIRRASREFTP